MSEPVKLYFIAGEASGDLHAGNLMKALLEKNGNIQFRFWGGDNMSAVAGAPVKHIKDLAFMGFIEVLLNLRTIVKNIQYCKNDILSYRPDALVLVDYPGFNLRIAEWAKINNIKVLYYISPQIWAWKQKRVFKIKKVVDKMFCILPFEKAFYAKFDLDVEFVGHPLIDAIHVFKESQQSSESFRSRNNLDNRPIIALLPGSRKQEIKMKLPIMLEAIKKKASDFQIVVAGAPGLDKLFYASVVKTSNCSFVFGETYNLLSTATAALVTSGTATLETALFKVPEVVCYKGSTLSYWIARQLIKVKYISLVNLIMDREIVKECIQHECNAKTIEMELNKILPSGEKREEMIQNYNVLIEKLGGAGASDTTAKQMLKILKKG
jgi:lipid-A-disaccharide synthase